MRIAGQGDSPARRSTMLPWLIDLGLGVVDLGLVAAATAILLESVPGSLKRRRAPRRQPGQADDEDPEA